MLYLVKLEEDVNPVDIEWVKGLLAMRKNQFQYDQHFIPEKDGFQICLPKEVENTSSSEIDVRKSLFLESLKENGESSRKVGKGHGPELGGPKASIRPKKLSFNLSYDSNTLKTLKVNERLEFCMDLGQLEGLRQSSRSKSEALSSHDIRTRNSKSRGVEEEVANVLAAGTSLGFDFSEVEDEVLGVIRSLWGMLLTRGVGVEADGASVLSISDRNLILIGEKVEEWGQKPFRVFNGWLEDKCLMMDVVKGWKGCKVEGSKGFSLAATLRGAKSSMKKVSDHVLFKEGVLEFFKDYFSNVRWKRPKIRGLNFRQLSEVEKEASEVGFSEEEFIHEFHKNGEIVKDLNKKFLALIPKCAHPETMRDYRPISLVSSMYKILVKALANCLKVVMNSIVGVSQMAFVNDRQLMDSFVVAEEIIHSWRRDKEGSLLVKLDFEKAFDSVNHSFLEFVMNEMGFGSR
ncbi:hypothetical protein Dsin_022860 [Dipteronia sinensis]|uniref:Reverse transcriptase domain-containing protein n=1 Tax=Dipteronia sinensis TaxID=43782 RepID=A0AAE0A2S1_9ROSI|nr:hypothetical protein Dsin_022860 [Dipteronia sinensis]